MAAKQRKIGRPTRSSEGKAAQLTVRLRPSVLTALDIIARQRRISMSEAAEYVVDTFARSYRVGDTTAAALAQMIGAFIDEEAGRIENFDAHDGIEYTQAQQQQIARHFFKVTGLGHAIVLPDDLLSAREQFAKAVFEIPGPGYWTKGDLLARLIEEGMRDGSNPKDVAKEWRRLAKAEIASEREGPKS
jgi:hypothetical protein